VTPKVALEIAAAEADRPPQQKLKRQKKVEASRTIFSETLTSTTRTKGGLIPFAELHLCIFIKP